MSPLYFFESSIGGGIGARGHDNGTSRAAIGASETEQTRLAHFKWI